jgi:hypothetical protein
LQQSPTEPTPYDSPQLITLSRIGYSADKKTFFFHFKVLSDGREGFVEMDVGERTPSTISGRVYYLIPTNIKNDKGTWFIAYITFTKEIDQK